MSFLKLILKNPFRNKRRVLLTLIGMGIGIATIVALGSVTDGMLESTDDTLYSAGYDLTITGKTTNDSSLSQGLNSNTVDFNQSYLDKIQHVKGVNRTVPIYIATLPTTNSPTFTLIGMGPENQDVAEITIIEGRMYKTGTHEIVLGKLAAENENKNVNDTIKFNGEEFKIVGIYESANPIEDQGGFAPLQITQDLMDVGNNINTIYVKVDKNSDVDAVEDNIKSLYGDNLTIISSLSDLKMIDNIMGLLSESRFIISSLAIILGGIGIINTMLSSVRERVREIGLLKAVGWSNTRIVVMIIGESVFVTVLAGIIGSIGGIIVVEILSLIGVFSVFSPVYTITTFANAFGIAVLLGVIGGLCPVYRIIHLPPTKALSYE